MATPPSQAQLKFDRLTGPSAAEILQAMPSATEKVFENDWLDFKSGKPAPEDIAKIWSKALGAFANNEGGVLVWGIVAEKDPADKIDAVKAIDLVPNIFQLKSRLQELHRQATDPPVPQVIIKDIPAADGSKEGFVVCLIPESPFRPHRSEQAGKQFYIRMGDSAQVCSVSLLRLLFYPQKHHRIQVSMQKKAVQRLRLRPGPITDQNDSKEVILVTISNIGNSSLNDVFLGVRCGNGRVHELRYTDNMCTIHRRPAVDKLVPAFHPHMEFALNLALDAENSADNHPWLFSVYAEDMRPKRALLKIAPDAPIGHIVTAECTEIEYQP